MAKLNKPQICCNLMGINGKGAVNPIIKNENPKMKSGLNKFNFVRIYLYFIRFINVPTVRAK